MIFPSIIEENTNKVTTILSLGDNPKLTPIGNIFSKKPFRTLRHNQTLAPKGNSFSKNPFRICLYGHCNGVFCIRKYHHKDLLLWNPTTIEVHVLPQPSFDVTKVEKGEALIGFGVDPNTKEFKVVKVSIHHHKGLFIFFH